MRRRDALTSLAALLLARAGRCATPVDAYVDPSQADLPWPYFSFARQPWRSYLETVPARRLTDGVGVVWGPAPPGRSEDDVARELAAAGFRRARLELPWGSMRWDETGIVAAHAERTRWILRALAAHGLRPAILLNAHHNSPCPMRVTRARVASAVAAGSRRIVVAEGAASISAGDSMIVTLADAGHAGPLIVAVDGDALTLSKPLARDLAAGEVLEVGRLKYLPLYPKGRAELEHTLDGWLRYVRFTARLVAEHVGGEFDVEIWNELTFGSEFLDVNFYYDPPLFARGPDFLHAGGAAWELGKRTVDAVREAAPAARVIWGFSNTTAFHTRVAELPPGVNGQSYHPYGVGSRCYDRMIAGKERYNADAFVPSGCATMPEGWAQTFQQTETFVRLLSPAARAERPPGVAEFRHYFTEHGFAPRELGITDRAAALRAKEKFVLRAPLFWLNKGLSGLYVYATYDADDTRFGVLGHDGRASPALRALQRLLARFAGAEDGGEPRSLNARVAPVGPARAVYANDPDGRHVSQPDLVVLLPYRVSAAKVIVGAYVMTEDFPRDLEPQAYRIELEDVELHGSTGDGVRVEYYDPLADSLEPVSVAAASRNAVIVSVGLTDSPRLIEVTAA